jgi:hypothetical protein
MHRYTFDSAAETAEGFAGLDALCNFRSFRLLETTAIALACVPDRSQRRTSSTRP